MGDRYTGKPCDTTIVSLGTGVAPDLIFSNPAGARFGTTDPAGAGAECS